MARARRRVRQARHPARARPGAAEAAPSALLEALKRRGPSSIRALAAAAGITYEAVRQQMAQLLRAGWVVATGAGAGARTAPAAKRRPRGPASQHYRLSTAAESLFPKHYDELSGELVRQVLETFGGTGLVEILARMTAARVRRWAPLLEGKSLREKLRLLSSLYEDKDAYMELEWKEGAPALIERNCPFFSVAQKHPAICSVSVNTLERLLGFKVVREQRFQAGHGRCVFRVRLDEPQPQGAPFALEQK